MQPFYYLKYFQCSSTAFACAGPIHLWEYLLELLNDRRYRDIAIWTNVDAGEFMLLDSEVVAALWGLHRNKTTMNYDKMSRALRYYYKKIINKVCEYAMYQQLAEHFSYCIVAYWFLFFSPTYGIVTVIYWYL